MHKPALSSFLPFLIGVASGAAVLAVLGAWQRSGRDEGTQGLLVEPVQVNASSLMSSYVCRKGERKEIVIHGVDDNFSPVGDETIKVGALHEFMGARTGRKGAIRVNRGYDSGDRDNMLLDSFPVSPRTVHGLFIARVREIETPENDTISLGDIRSVFDQAHFSDAVISKLSPRSEAGWRREGDLVIAQIEQLQFPARFMNNGDRMDQTYRSPLEMIRSEVGGGFLDLAVSDDTMVDFAGIVTCNEPAEARGTTFIVENLPTLEGHVKLSCAQIDGQAHCDPYVGDTSCDVSLPLACIQERHIPAPSEITERNLSGSWTGGDIAFTTPVAGSVFAFQSEVHAACQNAFGTDWRAVNIHDGLMVDQMIARGQKPSEGIAWIDSPTEPYGNCWQLNSSQGPTDQ